MQAQREAENYLVTHTQSTHIQYMSHMCSIFHHAVFIRFVNSSVASMCKYMQSKSIFIMSSPPGLTTFLGGDPVTHTHTPLSSLV